MINPRRHLKYLLLFILTGFFKLAIAQSDTISYRLYTLRDSIPLNSDVELVCQFVYPLNLGGKIFRTDENWQLENLISTASGSNSSLITRNDSIKYIKKQYQYFYRPQSTGDASIKNITFHQFNKKGVFEKTLKLGNVKVFILPPEMSEPDFGKSWIILSVFLILNFIIIIIFVLRRKKAQKKVPGSNKFISALKKRLRVEDGISDFEIFNYFWELWQFHFHIDKSLATIPLDEKVVNKLGLTGNQIKLVEKGIGIILRSKPDETAVNERNELIKVLKFLIQQKEKQLY